jgi:5-methylcytosine-specific restriction protein A
VPVFTFEFVRNTDVVAEVLLRANGICEACRTPAPFIRRKDKSPYLEVHHRKPLADGGEDTVANAVAVCPNCHRQAHYGA